jgi:Uma2 family endonuclease
MADQTQIRMTASEFFQLPETTQPIELIDGELIMSPAPVPPHQRASRRLIVLLDAIIPDGELFYAPIDVYLDDENVVQPDILWIAKDSHCKTGEKRLEGPPDLVIEVFSPGTARRDKVTKFRLYERHGVREYWMVDPQERYIEVHRLESGRFVLQSVYEPGMTFASAVLGGQIIDVNRIFAEN